MKWLTIVSFFAIIALAFSIAVKVQPPKSSEEGPMDDPFPKKRKPGKPPVEVNNF